MMVVPASAVNQEKKRKAIEIRKGGVILTLFADDMIVTQEFQRIYKKNCLAISQFSKFTEQIKDKYTEYSIIPYDSNGNGTTEISYI